MNPKKDLRTVRLEMGLRLEDLSSGLLRPATISEIENGRRVPLRRTRIQLKSILGEICWRKTLAGPDRMHIMRTLSEFVNPDEPGAG